MVDVPKASQPVSQPAIYRQTNIQTDRQTDIISTYRQIDIIISFIIIHARSVVCGVKQPYVSECNRPKSLRLIGFRLKLVNVCCCILFIHPIVLGFQIIKQIYNNNSEKTLKSRCVFLCYTTDEVRYKRERGTCVFPNE